ncbi:hypothetical protein bcere0016_41690 [Bacillus cereus 95/8201]|uniref:Uncharacterized protein n=1 Tax=Bacillus cereus (strain 03BB102) TaxID=572264 RepID=A0A158RGW3_BACC3|nr:hypothetical protein BCA_4455 [Bacillus cereus 03BB102]ACP12986.1 hypothetical protein BAMEG_4608 [Bacillus anthracis str. CDC 684]ACQ50240.1 hypothetical protein BAA_4590 [Bacillus anthracis str. A0248]AHK40514.1 hypothetical protein BAPAT_4386 [Bacillus anthracis str. SVA11]EDR16583.1 hypothetical protein BAC_4569 [Bacillus anthracis str. A0488]EDR92692.1 hypothetical protein BAH_4624 [Bacillus anthracis str. A0442]EDS96547.1 hypothetical protein BAK_4653 [Bacillus anthracis str. A0389]
MKTLYIMNNNDDLQKKDKKLKQLVHTKFTRIYYYRNCT